ncbi:MAG: 3-isopropylmalate dehydratase small subunit, partial [Alphaproteobacteria bacterium HGW-Alphaproteobacteria-16]
MEPFTTLTSVAAPLPIDDIDTDIIYPARFMLLAGKDGLGRYAFHDWRFDA